MASFFAVDIACINAASRVLYTMGEEDILPRALGRAHRHPPDAVRGDRVIAPIVIVVPIVMVASGVEPLNVIGYTGTIGTFGYMLAYLLMAIALPFFLRRRNEANPLSTVLAVVVVAALLYVFCKNVYPVPPYPFNRMPWIFLGAPRPRPGLVRHRPRPEPGGAAGGGHDGGGADPAGDSGGRGPLPGRRGDRGGPSRGRHTDPGR